MNFFCLQNLFKNWNLRLHFGHLSKNKNSLSQNRLLEHEYMYKNIARNTAPKYKLLLTFVTGLSLTFFQWNKTLFACLVAFVLLILDTWQRFYHEYLSDRWLFTLRDYCFDKTDWSLSLNFMHPFNYKLLNIVTLN